MLTCHMRVLLQRELAVPREVPVFQEVSCLHAETVGVPCPSFELCCCLHLLSRPTAATPFSICRQVLPAETTGFSGGALNRSGGIAIDASGNAWVTHTSINTLTLSRVLGRPPLEVPNSGGGLAYPSGIPIDGDGNLWISPVQILLYGSIGLDESASALASAV